MHAIQPFSPLVVVAVAAVLVDAFAIVHFGHHQYALNVADDAVDVELRVVV